MVNFTDIGEKIILNFHKIMELCGSVVGNFLETIKFTNIDHLKNTVFCIQVIHLGASNPVFVYKLFYR